MDVIEIGQLPYITTFLNWGVACAPQAIFLWVENFNFFGKEVFFVHSDTAVQKRPSRGSEKKNIYIQTSRTENRAKKGRFFGFSPLWACFEGSKWHPKPLKNQRFTASKMPPTPSQEHGVPMVFFDLSDPRYPKHDIGSPWRSRWPFVNGGIRVYKK